MDSLFQTLTRFFGGNNNSGTSNRRDQTMSSTHDAFSIPNHSPTFPNSSLFPEQPNSGNSQDYSYPPPSSPAYPPQRHEDTMMGPNGNGAGGQADPAGSILPTHNNRRSGYPPLQQSWSRIQRWLTRNYPELGDTLNYGILPEDLHEIQLQFGFALPHTIRDSYALVDGQEAESSAGCTEGLFFGLSLLSLEEVVEEWKFWRDVDDDPATGANSALLQRMKSIPSGWVRCDYSNRGWIPLATDRVGNYLGVDINPGEKGAPGQVIVFGRDFDTKVVLWRGDSEFGWAKWLANFAEELETGDMLEVGNNDANSDDSEDDIGHESYFFDGGLSRNRGLKGGESQAIGIRLTGEYRGWNVLEALADKSVKKWKEAGVVTEEEYPSVDTRKPSALDSMQAIQQDNGIEVPIPLIDDTPTNSVDGHGQQRLASEPETPRAPTHAPAKMSVSVNRPVPRPIALPTASDIAVDVESSNLEDELMTPGRRGMPDDDIERGRRMPAGHLHVNNGTDGQLTAMSDRTTFSPRISDEDTRLLKRISVEPPTPVTTDSAGEIITVPHKRRSPSPAEDLLQDEEAPLPLADGTPKKGGNAAPLPKEPETAAP